MDNNTISTETEVRPGLHPSFAFGKYDAAESAIVKCFSREWYVTHSGDSIHLGASVYRYFLAKPPSHIQHLINIDREIVVLFSPYRVFEPRTLDAISTAQNRHPKLRIERLCSILISQDEHISIRLQDLLKNDQEAQIVVPFCYSEFPKGPDDPYFFRNRLKRFFYSRDLFSAESPLKSDLFFFGRRDVIHELVSRHRASQAAGIFGLRKAGKTSLLNGVKRALDADEGLAVTIDCQDTAFHQKRWNEALRYILGQIKDQTASHERIRQESQFSPEQASEAFEHGLRGILTSINKQKILLIFDEIENISFGVSPSQHWREGQDFIFFWQTLRAVFQKPFSPLTYVICGTNPLAVEQQTILGFDNPIYAQIPLEYIPRFTHDQTREMVRKLGRISGLHFQEHLYGQLNEDFGGHPYLIRQVCSIIHKTAPVDRPVDVTSKTYERAKAEFVAKHTHFFEMIIGVLRHFFPEEYALLQLLASDEEEAFTHHIHERPISLSHLIGYGIIDRSHDGYYFRITALKEYISGRDRYTKNKLTHEQKWAEVSERRNRLETKLRRLIKNQLMMFYGKNEARDKIVSILSDKKLASKLDYSELFDANKNHIYFIDLVKILRKEWDLFQELLGSDKEKLINYLSHINSLRSDAHAKPITPDEFTIFRIAASHFENALQQYD